MWCQSCNQIVVVTITTAAAAAAAAQHERENINLLFQAFKDPFHQHLQL
jgi:hypothetical protein